MSHALYQRLLDGQLWQMICWIAALALVGVVVVWWWRPETHPYLIGFQAFAGWILLAAYPLLLVASLQRAVPLAVLALILVLAQAYWTAGTIALHGSRPAPTDSTVVSLLTVNVLTHNPDVGGLARDLAASDAQIIILQEVTEEIADGLRRHGILAAYPHQVLHPLAGFHGAAILSTLPISDGGPFDAGGYPMLKAEVATASGPLLILCIHPPAPLTADHLGVWRRQFAFMDGWAGLSRGRPTVLAGDFNATADHRSFRRLLASGLRDAFAESGTGLGSTWPQWRGPVPPLLRLDHVLVSETVTVLSIETESTVGSDHRRLVARLALPPR